MATPVHLPTAAGVATDLTKFDFLVFAALVIVLWEVAKRLWGHVFGTDDEVPAQDTSEEFADLPVPADPHVEIAMDPPCGLHFSNPKQPYFYENSTTRGSYLFFHPPAGPSMATGPEGFDYADYFSCKSRLWEVRVHMIFKAPPPPDEDLFFGVELEEYMPVSMASRRAQQVIVAGIRQAVGGVYHSVGDDPGKVGGEPERPVCVLPLWAFDQFAVTPEGQEPPNLWDANFCDFGQRRYKRIAKYSEEITKLSKSFKIGPTYTFAFWGVSRFLDVLNWSVIGLPVVTPANVNNFCGKPPIHVVLYSLKRDQAGDARHLQPRKTYYFRAALWSSEKRPHRQRIEALTGSAARHVDNADPVAKEQTLRRRFTGFMKRMSSCTGADRH